jgi:tetratricopeptide (TPR) repeat protein
MSIVELNHAGEAADVAATLATFGALLKMQGQLPEAENCLTRALAVYRQTGATKDESTVLNNLGRVMLAQGHRKEAERIFRKAIAQAERQLGLDHPDVAAGLSNLANLLVIRHDAAEVLDQMIPDGTLAAIHLFFPDPWPKKRHHKRRLVQPEFAALAARKLASAGVLHAATDWPEYADQMAAVFSENHGFEKTQRGFALRPATKFESRGKRLGNPIRDLFFRRRETARATR